MSRPSVRCAAWALRLGLGLLLGPIGLAAADEAPAPPPEPASASADIPGDTAFDASLSLRVNDREAALQKAIQLAKERGGWFASLQTDAVSLRVPTQSARGLVEALRGEGEVFDRSFQTADLSAERTELESQLKARRSVLDRYMEVLSSASSESVVAVEHEITRVVAEIEGIEGRLRVLDDRAAFAHVDVGFVFRERRAPTRDGRSSFPWLRGMNMGDLMVDLASGRRAARSHAKPTAPDGFSVFKGKGRFQAVSADDVIYRVRSVKNKPAADLGFWREALRTRQTEAGYRVVSDGKIESDGVEGYLIEMSGAMGARDQSYLVGIYVVGRRIIIVEATGEGDRLAKQRAGIVAAMQQLGL